jgi:peptidoglycan-associated lipoprotein
VALLQYWNIANNCYGIADNFGVQVVGFLPRRAWESVEEERRMNVVPQRFYRVCLMAALSAAIFNFGCAKKPLNTHPAPERTEEAAPRPTITFQADPTSINKGDVTTLKWSTTNATQVAIAPEVGPVAAEGSTKVTPADSMTYTLTATGPGGTADASVRITMASAPVAENTDADRDLDRIFHEQIKDAYFDLDKADIRGDARTALGATAEALRKYPQIKATIEGHCDERGSTEYNLGLGDRRATAVKNYLVSLGISADRLTTVSYGKEKPFCMEASEACYQQNRRGHFVRAN